jgi:hypothetical protein
LQTGDVKHLTVAELEAGLEEIRRSPGGTGQVEMIVRRPAVDAREELDQGRLVAGSGLEGDTWGVRRSSHTPDGSPDPECELTIMNARAAQLVSGDRGRWSLAGDQIFVDFDLSLSNLPAGTRLAIGDAVVEVSAVPHTGCGKFVKRFGVNAMKFVNSPIGKAHQLRGINAKVVKSGDVRRGDIVQRLST